MFGLTGPEGNHGEDVKEHWWYLDAVPSHAWNRWRYHYPQAAFPYDELRAETRAGTGAAPEYEILDTGVFDQDRYWITEVTYAKATTRPTCWSTVTVTNAGPDADTIHVLPTAWFRNTWSWDDSAKPGLRIAANGAATRSTVDIDHPFLGYARAARGHRVRTGPPPDAAVLRERDQRRAALRCAAGHQPTRRTGSTTTSSAAPPR